jgi:formylglycine-generating enzyme required for sulfatase activity
MRWVPPGRFTMGSPANEAGRWDREGPQYDVQLTQGFWLFDTPCTQGLWQAVMGTHPSRFKGESRPVEQVSW